MHRYIPTSVIVLQCGGVVHGLIYLAIQWRQRTTTVLYQFHAHPHTLPTPSTSQKVQKPTPHPDSEIDERETFFCPHTHSLHNGVLGCRTLGKIKTVHGIHGTRYQHLHTESCSVLYQLIPGVSSPEKKCYIRLARLKRGRARRIRGTLYAHYVRANTPCHQPISKSHFFTISLQCDDPLALFRITVYLIYI